MIIKLIIGHFPSSHEGNKYIATLFGLSQKNGPDKNGPAGPILGEKIVRPDQYWPTKYGPAGPILVTKGGPA